MIPDIFKLCNDSYKKASGCDNWKHLLKLTLAAGSRAGHQVWTAEQWPEGSGLPQNTTEYYHSFNYHHQITLIIVMPLRVRPYARHFPTMMSFLFFQVAYYFLAIILPPFTCVLWLPSNSVNNFSACPAWITNDPGIPHRSTSLIYLTNICGLPLMCQYGIMFWWFQM